MRYAEIQEHEAAVRQLRRQSLHSPRRTATAAHTATAQPAQRRGRKRQASRSLSATLVVPNQPARPLQRRKSSEEPSFVDVAQHGRLYDHVNSGNRQQWIATCSSILRRYQLASIAEGAAGKTDAFADLMLLPGQVLAKVNRGGKRSRQRGTRTPTVVIRQRLAQRLSGLPLVETGEDQDAQPENITAPRRHTAPPHASHEPNNALPTSPLIPAPMTAADSEDPLDPFDGFNSAEDKAAACRANRLVHHGHIRKAAHVLNSTTRKADTSDPEVMDLLKALHPPPREGGLFPALPSTAPLIHFDDDDSAIYRILRQSNNGSAAGPSGWGGNMVSILADDRRCSSALLRLLQDIANDGITDAMRSLLLSCDLVAIEKPAGGLRPIAVGELFYRITATIAVRRVRETAVPILECNTRLECYPKSAR